MCPNTFIFVKGNIDRREYLILSTVACKPTLEVATTSALATSRKRLTHSSLSRRAPTKLCATAKVWLAPSPRPTPQHEQPYDGNAWNDLIGSS
jgi:hypothetical protein